MQGRQKATGHQVGSECGGRVNLETPDTGMWGTVWGSCYILEIGTTATVKSVYPEKEEKIIYLRLKDVASYEGGCT